MLGLRGHLSKAGRFAAGAGSVYVGLMVVAWAGRAQSITATFDHTQLATNVPSPRTREPAQTIRMAVQGSNLQVSLDGQLQTFTQNGAQVTTVTLPATNGTNNGTVGISFGDEDNSNLPGGQRAANLVVSAYSALGQ